MSPARSVEAPSRRWPQISVIEVFVTFADIEISPLNKQCGRPRKKSHSKAGLASVTERLCPPPQWLAPGLASTRRIGSGPLTIFARVHSFCIVLLTVMLGR